VIEAVVGGERDSFFAGGKGGVPGVEFEMSAAKQIVVFGGGSVVDLLFEGLDGLVDAACGEESLGRVGGGEWECND
jgi:hypothetical protein